MYSKALKCKKTLFFSIRNLNVSVHATAYIDFNQEIDSRIINSDLWKESFPMKTSVSVPDHYAEEIKAKLIAHPHITFVGGQAKLSATEFAFKKAYELKNENYLTTEKYDSLSSIDKDALNEILFTYTGYYALDEKYITIEEFLSAPTDARKNLSMFFYNAEETHREAQIARKTIDRMFKNKHFNLDLFIGFSNDERKMLVKLLTLPDQIGMNAIEKGCFTVYEFLTLDEQQQDILFKIFRDYSCYDFHPEYIGEIKEQMSEFRNLNNDRRFTSNNRC